MRLDIKNFGLIKSANIDINGLTVICGENDSGKSSIGKILFSIVKANREYKSVIEKEIVSNISNNLVKISGLLINSTQVSVRNREAYLLIKSIDPEYLLVTRNIEVLSEAILDLDLDSQRYKLIHQYIEQIEEWINEPIDKKKIQKDSLNKIFYSEFKEYKGDCSEISISDDNVVLKCNIKNSFIDDFILDEVIDVTDITYIESPFILQFMRMILTAALMEQEKNDLSWQSIPLHLIDLVMKLSNYDPNVVNLSGNEDLIYISNDISNLINGDFNYSKEKNDFVLIRDGQEYQSINIASGIKSLGLINSLLKSGEINKKTLLILDEPETNLHPMWQNEYARILCELVRSNIRVIAATHSPYMVSALYHYSKGLSNKNFYWANKERGLTTFDDKTESVMEDIVEKFASAFEGMY